MFLWRRFVKTEAFKTISILLHIKSSMNTISWHFCTRATNLFLPRLALLLSGRVQTWRSGPPRRVLTWAGVPGGRGGAGAAWPAGMISEEAAEATHKRVRQYLPAAPQPQGLADPHHVGPHGLPVGGERPAAQQPGFVAPPKLLLEPTRAAVQS